MISSCLPNPYIWLFANAQYHLGFSTYAKLYPQMQILIDVSLYDSKYYDILASALRQAGSGRYEDAERLLKRCLSIQPSATDATYFLGAVRAAEGRPEEARHAWLESISRMHVLDNDTPHYGVVYAVGGAYLILAAERKLEATKKPLPRHVCGDAEAKR